jgi:hypothetical protein
MTGHWESNEATALSMSEDLLPPPVIEETRRNWTGWLFLGVLIGLQILVALTDSLSTKPPSLQTHDDQQEVLQAYMQSESGRSTNPQTVADKSKTDTDKKREDLTSAATELSKQPKSDHMAAKLSAAIETELRGTVKPAVLGPLLTSKTPVDRLFVEIYGSQKLTLSKARQMVALLPDFPFIYTAAKVHALEKAGDKGALVRLVPPKNSTFGRIAAFFTLMCFAISLSVWSQYWTKYKDGTLLLRGIPMDKITSLDADRLAIRAAQIFALFLIVQTVVASFPREYFDLVARVAVIVVLMVVGVIALQRLEVDGKKITLEMLGVSTRNLWQDVATGVQGFFAEFPIAMILAGIGSVIFSFLPKATHPATEVLARDHSLGTIIPVVILGSVLAPFWEELVFRGLIFPALKKFLGGIAPGLLVSSFLFASLHPQGISIWLALSSVGAASCLLSYQSRSLVPSMVMHCLHNSAVFALTLLVQ